MVLINPVQFFWENWCFLGGFQTNQNWWLFDFSSFFPKEPNLVVFLKNYDSFQELELAVLWFWFVLQRIGTTNSLEPANLPLWNTYLKKLKSASNEQNLIPILENKVPSWALNKVAVDEDLSCPSKSVGQRELHDSQKRGLGQGTSWAFTFAYLECLAHVNLKVIPWHIQQPPK